MKDDDWKKVIYTNLIKFACNLILPDFTETIFKFLIITYTPKFAIDRNSEDIFSSFQTIQVGQSFQAEVPRGLSKYDDTPGKK